MTKLGIENIEQADDHKFESIPCHPRREPKVDLTSIQEKLMLIRIEKEKAKELKRQQQQLLNKQKDPYDLNYFQQAMNDSVKLLPANFLQQIQQKLKFVEDKVYIGTKDNSNSEYVSRLIDESIPSTLKDHMDILFTNISEAIERDIVDGAFDLHKAHQWKDNSSLFSTKKTELQIMKVTKTSRNSQKDGELIVQHLQESPTIHVSSSTKGSPLSTIRQSSGLSSPIPKKSIGSSEKNITKINPDQFDPSSQKTKVAQEFIKKIQDEQQKNRVALQKKIQAQREQQLKNQQNQKELNQFMKKQKHQIIQMRHKKQRQLQQAQKKHQKALQQQFKQFMSQYKHRKPLFKQKQAAFEEKQKQDLVRKQNQVLKSLKQERKPLDLVQLKGHQERYAQFKREHQKQRQAQMKLIQKQREFKYKKTPYFSKYHALIVQEAKVIPIDPTIQRNARIGKKKAFSEMVRKDYKPKSLRKSLDTPLNHKELLKLPLFPEKGRLQGNQNLKQLHSKIDQLRKQGKLRVNQCEVEPVYIPKIDYLRQIRSSQPYRTIDYDRMGKLSPEQAQKYADRYSQRAKNRQKVIRNSSNFSLTWFLKQTEQLDYQYIEAVRAKAALLAERQNSLTVQNQNISQIQSEL